jgi:teichuronic acid exporter
MSLEREAAAGLKWSAAGKLLSQVFSWGVTLLLLRLLAPGDYGLMALSSVLVASVGAIAEAGLGAALVQARDVSRDELARTAGTLAIVNGACALALVLVAPLVADLFSTPALTNVLRASAFHFVLNAVDAVPQSMAYRQMRFKWLTTLDLVGALVTSAATLALAAIGAGVWALVFGTLAGGMVRTVLLVTQGTAVWPEFALRGMGRHLRFGGAVTLGRVFWQLAHQFDVIFAGRALNQDAVGLYAVVMQLASLPMQKAMAIVNQVAFPAISRLQDEMPRLRTRLFEAIRLLFFVTVPVLWGVSAVADEVVDLLLDERWAAARFPLQMASLIVPLRMLSAVLSTAVAGVGCADIDLRNSVITFIVFPLAFAVGVQSGVDGLAASWVVAVPIVFALNWRRTRAVLDLDLATLVGAARGPVLAGAVMYAAVWGTHLAIEDLSLWIRLPVLIALGAAVYLSLVTVFDRGVWHDMRRFASALR